MVLELIFLFIASYRSFDELLLFFWRRLWLQTGHRPCLPTMSIVVSQGAICKFYFHIGPFWGVIGTSNLLLTNTNHLEYSPKHSRKHLKSYFPITSKLIWLQIIVDNCKLFEMFQFFNQKPSECLFTSWPFWWRHFPFQHIGISWEPCEGWCKDGNSVLHLNIGYTRGSSLWGF